MYRNIPKITKPKRTSIFRLLYALIFRNLNWKIKRRYLIQNGERVSAHMGMFSTYGWFAFLEAKNQQRWRWKLYDGAISDSYWREITDEIDNWHFSGQSGVNPLKKFRLEPKL